VSVAATQALMHPDKLNNQYFFFIEFDRFYLILGMAVMIAFLLSMAMQCCPGPMMHTILFLSTIV
jgi:hypothetical protein